MLGAGILPLQRHYFDQGGARLGDQERFAVGRTFDQELVEAVVDTLGPVPTEGGIETIGPVAGGDANVCILILLNADH